MNQKKAGAILQYAQMALGIIVGMLYTPAMIRILGQSEYGLYNTVSSTISMLSVLSMGFNSSYIRYYARYKKDNRNDEINRLNGLFLMIFTVIGCVALVCGLFLTKNLNLVFAQGLTADEYRIARILMLLLTINLAISFPMGVFSHIISAHERFVFLKVLGLLKTVVSPLVTLPLLLAGYRSITMVSVTVVIALITDVLYLSYAIGKLHVRFAFRHIEKGLFRELFTYTSFIAVNMVVDQINWNVDKVLLGRFKGTGAVAIYSVGYTLEHYYGMFSTSISHVFTPQIHRIVNRTLKDIEKQRIMLTELFVRIGRVQFLVLGLIASGFVFFGKQFVLLWAGSEYAEAYVVAVLLMLPATIPMIQNTGIEVQRALNLHKFRSVAYSIMAVINLALSVELCQRYGPIGSAAGTTISLVLANGLIMNVYYHKKCNLDIILFWKNILSMISGLIVPALAGVLMMRWLPMNSVWAYLAGIAVYTCVYVVSMWKLGMNAYERQLFTGLAEKCIRRFRRG